MRARAFLLWVLVPGCGVMPQDPGTSPADALAAAESAFAAHSVREGMRAAFLAHFAPDGVLVADGWTVAGDRLRPRPDPPIVLDWRPVHVEAAASGDLGLSTGPWKRSSRTDTLAPPAYGQFVSVWKREAGGPWRVVVDLGISHPPAALWDEPLRARVLRSSKVSEPIAAAEQAFAREARERGLRAAYASHASGALRLYRNGSPPAIGLPAALAGPLASVADWTWTVERTDTAASGDLAYARGRYALAASPDATAGYFLRVWRVEDGRWRIAVDVVNAAAAK